MKSSVDELFTQAYDSGRREALLETGLDEDALPETPEFTLVEARDPTWPPGLRTWEPEPGR